MARTLKTSGDVSSAMDSTVSQTSKEQSFVVNFPLTPSEIDWLKRQSKLVGEASIRFFEREGDKVDPP